MFSSHNSDVQDFPEPAHVEESANGKGGAGGEGVDGGESSSIGQLRDGGVERLTVDWLPAHDDEYLADHDAGRRIFTQALLERCVFAWGRDREGERKGEGESVLVQERELARGRENERETEKNRQRGERNK
jgi:hypothetical protein